MIHQIKKEQVLCANIDDVWDFVASPKNLKYITPEYMNFTINSNDLPTEMYAGMIISYKVSPIFKIPLNWVTEITQVDKKKYFVDEQRFGPYKMWHHQHIFEPHVNGVLMIDLISYKLPLGPLGKIINAIYIKNQLRSIFNYRFHKMNKIFNKK